MWFITHASSGETLCFLPEKLKYTVGRTNADLELQEDTCISRAHAVFHLIHNEEKLHVELEDVGSKYGTFYNKDIEKNTPLEKSKKIVLKENDLIRFGRLQNVWKVHCMNINVVTSSLSKVEAQQVETYIENIGGKILEQWSSSCTHLTMNDPSITMKLLHALVDQKLIVTPEYWKDLLNAVSKRKSQLPKPEQYSPRFDDDAIDVSGKPERRSLFKGTTFVFLNRKHFDMYSPIVKAAGGASKDLNSGVQKSFIIKNNVVVVQYTPSTQTQSTQTINTIAKYLESHSKRIIPEYEIGLAILHCSIEKFCNPCCKLTQTMSLSVPNDLLDITEDIDAQDTVPNIDTQTLDLEIPETNEHLETNKNLITSTPYFESPILRSKDSKEKETMLEMCVTETPALDNQRKRKVMSIDLNESDDEDLFQFKSKKQCQTKELNKETKDKTIPEAKSKSTPRKEENKSLNDKEMASTSKAKSTQNTIFSNFLEKTQKQYKSQVPPDESEKSSQTIKDTRKRPRIQVLDENDEGDNDEDLFSFGDTQKTKKSRGREENPTKDNEDDLFGFKDHETSKTKKQIKTINVDDEDSNDLVATQQFLVTEKSSKSKYIQMPKPKLLPRKVSAIDWLTGSLCKIKIKNENSNIKDEENAIKTESTVKNENDLNISEDHRKWLESLNGAIEIQQVSSNNTIKVNEKSNYRFKNRTNDNISTENLDGTTVKNFKTFVKKYCVSSAQNSSIIKLHLR